MIFPSKITKQNHCGFSLCQSSDMGLQTVRASYRALNLLLEDYNDTCNAAPLCIFAQTRMLQFLCIQFCEFLHKVKQM